MKQLSVDRWKSGSGTEDMERKFSSLGFPADTQAGTNYESQLMLWNLLTHVYPMVSQQIPYRLPTNTGHDYTSYHAFQTSQRNVYLFFKFLLIFYYV